MADARKSAAGRAIRPSDVRPVSIVDEMKRSVPRLRHERDRVARAARRARRAQAGAPPHPLFDARAGPHARQEIRQIGARGRRRDGQVPPARRHRDLRRAGAHGAGFLHAPDADRRPGQLRLGRRRCRRRRCATPSAGSAKPAMSLLADIDEDTVDFQANYDGNEHEPVVLPARFPNLLVNGAGGIAVGMATNIPPHNLGEVVDACVALIDDPALVDRRPDQHRSGPGFPDRRHHPRPRRHPLRLPHRPRLDRDARQGRDRDHPQGARSDHHHARSRTR